MKLSFLPGELFLETGEDGSYRLTLNGQEIFRGRSKKAAIAKFNQIRREMEELFPPHELSPEEKAEVFRRMIGDSLVQHNSLGGRAKKKSAGSTRTFGG